jgi:hypothetical protein
MLRTAASSTRTRCPRLADRPSISKLLQSSPLSESTTRIVRALHQHQRNPAIYFPISPLSAASTRLRVHNNYHLLSSTNLQQRSYSKDAGAVNKARRGLAVWPSLSSRLSSPIILPLQQHSICTRWMSVDSNGGKNIDGVAKVTKDSQSASTQPEKIDGEASKSVEGSSSNGGISSMSKNNNNNKDSNPELKESGRIASMVDSVGSNIKRVSEEWNTGDLMSVYGIIALISVILAAPMVVR